LIEDSQHRYHIKATLTMTTDDNLGAERSPYVVRANRSVELARPAFAHLLHLAETRDSGQIARIAKFIAATYNSRVHSFDLFDLRGLDVDIGDKMLTCLDCLRWGMSDLYRLVPDGDARVRAVIDLWGLRPTTRD